MTDEDAKAAGVFAAILSQAILEALVVTNRLSLEDAVNVLVEVGRQARLGDDETAKRVAGAALMVETSFRKRREEASGGRVN